MSFYKADLHLHSCLSPCGSLEMSPQAIAAKAKNIGLHLIALTDHNSALNCPAFDAACRSFGISAVFGLEVCTSEELHCLSLFETVEQALEMSSWSYEQIMPIPNNPEKMGDQVYVDENEVILGEVEYNLTASIEADLHSVLEKTHDLNGLCIPSHIDRSLFSIYSQLGFLPPDDYDALELYKQPPILETGNHSLITNSDAHYIEGIGSRWFEFKGDAPNFKDLQKALKERTITIQDL